LAIAKIIEIVKGLKTETLKHRGTEEAEPQRIAKSPLCGPSSEIVLILQGFLNPIMPV
jgi:hypothetical protein